MPPPSAGLGVGAVVSVRARNLFPKKALEGIPQTPDGKITDLSVSRSSPLVDPFLASLATPSRLSPPSA